MKRGLPAVLLLLASGCTCLVDPDAVPPPAPRGLTYSLNPAVYTRGQAIQDNVPSSSGGPAESYAVEPALPPGLALDTSTGVISGTPSALSPVAAYTVTATNSGGSTTAALSIGVYDHPPPSGLVYSTNPATYGRGQAIAPNTPSSGGGPVDSYGLNRPLPPGLTMSASTGVISGTPTAVTASAVYTVTASNLGGSTTAALTITVNDVPPSGLAYSANPASYIVGLAIQPNVPSSAGGAVVSYSVNPSLPPGLALDPSTGVITGTPVAVTSAANYTVTATNSGGSTTATVNIAVNVHGRPANVLVILDTSASMQDWPQQWPTSRGCDHSSITSLGYNPSATYPPMWANKNFPNNDWFDNTLFYNAPDQGYGTNFNGRPSDNFWVTPYTSATSACSSAPGGMVALCQSCLATQGYYVDGSFRRVTGNFLNFYGPRDAGAVNALTQVTHDVLNVRFGVHVFKRTISSGCADTANACFCSLESMGPRCSRSYPLDGTEVDNQRSNILSNLRSSLGWGGCGTQLKRVLYYGGLALSSQNPLGVPASWSFPDVFREGPTGDERSVCFDCGFSAIVLLADGDPQGDSYSLPPEITSLTVPACPSPCPVSDLPKVAKWFWDNDIRRDPDQPGAQKIATYTIGFSIDVASSNLLLHTAEQGGGKFFGAISTSGLRLAFQNVIDDITARNNSCYPALTP